MDLKPKQYELIEAMMANPMVPDTELAKLVGIDRNTIRKWKKIPEFEKEYKDRLHEKWADGERIAVETMLSLAREGNFQASKYVLDNLGYAPVQKSQVEANVSNNIVLNIDEEE